jgi:hypothetical protein
LRARLSSVLLFSWPGRLSRYALFVGGGAVVEAENTRAGRGANGAYLDGARVNFHDERNDLSRRQIPEALCRS